MVIDYSKVEEKALANFKGGEGAFNVKMFSDDSAKIMYGRLEPGCSIGLHTHESNCEMIYIISGTADYIYDDTREKAEPGMAHYCPKGHSHSMINNGTEPVIFFAVVPEQ